MISRLTDKTSSVDDRGTSLPGVIYTIHENLKIWLKTEKRKKVKKNAEKGKKTNHRTKQENVSGAFSSSSSSSSSFLLCVRVERRNDRLMPHGTSAVEDGIVDVNTLPSRAYAHHMQ